MERMECKNGQLDIWEISDINGGMECNDGQLGVWEIILAIKMCTWSCWGNHA